MRPRRTAVPVVLGAAALALAACGGGSPAAKRSTTTLPPLPKNLVALVTLAGTASDVGSGDEVVPISLPTSSGASNGGASPGGQQVGGAIKVGTYPDAVAITPDGETAYVANYSSNSVTPVDLKTDQAGTPIPVGVGPADIAIAPDGKTAYVTDDGSASTLGDTVTPIDLATGKAEKPITVGAGPQGIAITPNGATAYVADAGAIVAGQAGGIGHTVTPIDLATGKAEKPITVGNGPTGIAISPDGSTVYVTNLDSQSVTPISTASNTPSAAIAVPGGPVAVAIGAGEAWVVDTPSNTSPGDNVVPISLSSDQAGSPVAVGKGAQDLAISPDGKTAWVTCLSSGTLVPIDLATRKAGAAITVAGGPFALAVGLVAS